MHALTFGGKEIIHYSTVNDPVLLQPTDVIVKITKAGLCGSDLHVYHGRETGLDHGTVMGHEFTGVIEEAGKDVKKFKKGAKVLSPFTTSCGECFYCSIGLTCRCEKGNLFGWVEKDHGLHGAQAAYIRVPMADSTLLPLSNDLDEEKGLLLGDIFSTGYFCADKAEIKPGGVYAVIGCGPVGLMAVLAAKHLNCSTLFAIDVVPERLAMAAKFGAIPLNSLYVDVKETIRQHTAGRGADGILELAGNEQSLRLAIELVRPGGIISSASVHTEKNFSFSPGEVYDKNLVYKSGRCPAHFYAEKLIREEVAQKLPIEEIITHRLPLTEGVKAYDIFAKRKENCIKVILLPHEL